LDPATCRPATLTILSEPGSNFRVRILEERTEELRLEVEDKIALRTPAKVETEDRVVLGVVVEFQPGPPATAVLAIEHVISNTAELLRHSDLWLR
jgi:hypothetical protein